LGFGAFHPLEDRGLGYFHTGELPLRDRHLLQIELFGSGLRLPFGFEVVAELGKFIAAFARQHDGAGAEAVTERFE
jgi:hypothetical protein